MGKKRINRKHKDRLFLMIFREKSDLLELYNALNETNYENAEDLEINTLEDAVNQAVDCCIEEGILESFLRKHRGEVYQLLLTEYDEQQFLEQEREVWKEEGRSEGFATGLGRGQTIGEQRIKLLLQYLIDHSREDEIQRILVDPVFQETILAESGLK